MSTFLTTYKTFQKVALEQKVPIELCSIPFLWRLFLQMEKEIPHMADCRFDLVELAADIHTAYQRKNYGEFRTLLLEFIREGKY